MLDFVGEIRTNPLATFSYGLLNMDTPAKTYIAQLCADTWCCLEDLTRAMSGRMDGEGELKESVLSAHHVNDI